MCCGILPGFCVSRLVSLCLAWNRTIITTVGSLLFFSKGVLTESRPEFINVTLFAGKNKRLNLMIARSEESYMTTITY